MSKLASFLCYVNSNLAREAGRLYEWEEKQEPRARRFYAFRRGTMTKPLIFISHKHSDRAIANAVRSFVTERSSGNVRVFQSSDAAALGPMLFT